MKEMKNNDKNHGLDRRGFLKRLGLGAAVSAGAYMAACKGEKNTNQGQIALTPISNGSMTYRVNSKTGDKVSLLGYGCMRWPTTPDGELDQETINQLVDTAIAHGVNYFDTSPAYCKGLSEKATGIALKRHPRDRYFIATKLSNFAPQTWSREES